ncbi:hypothetical protein [Psychrobacter sp. TB55-MNA-CIBAN-0194]|uniref:hypothetical protein n=1 Tax=Psychrobacter sp. TB55-MNA-CIBAN-0194 TaxID=3140445 RepID=UPI0033347089
MNKYTFSTFHLNKLAAVFILSIMSPNVYCFDVYTFVPWKYYLEKGELHQTKNLDDYLAKNGTKKAFVVYPKAMFTQDSPDPVKIREIAKLSQKNPDALISFDIEIGNKMKPETILPTVEKTLSLYHKNNGNTLVGVYGLLPQNTVGSNFKESKYTQLNSKYANIAPLTTVLSPVLYNYDGEDFEKWKISADFAFEATKKYSNTHKIIPYLSPIYKVKRRTDNPKGFVIKQLSESDMKKRLDYLKSLNADGVLIWESSQSIEFDRSQPIFNPYTGWGKAIIDTVKSK